MFTCVTVFLTEVSYPEVTKVNNSLSIEFNGAESSCSSSPGKKKITSFTQTLVTMKEKIIYLKYGTLKMHSSSWLDDFI